MAGSSILVVDDDPEIRRMIGRLLEHEGFAPRLAADGEEALRLCQEQLPDAIVADLMMPKLDGEAFLLELEQVSPRHGVPIVLLTASALRKEVADRLGVAASLAKPFDTTQLVELLLDLTGR